MAFVDALRRLAVTEESLANFATDLTGSGTYLDVPALEGTIELDLQEPPLETNLVQQDVDGYAPTVPGPLRASLNFSCRLAAMGTAAGDGVGVILNDAAGLLEVLRLTFGGIHPTSAASGTDVASAADARTITLTSATGFVPGGALGWVDATGVYHCREIASVATDTVTLKQDLPATPSTGDDIYLGVTIYPTGTNDSSLQFIVEGDNPEDRWLLLGGQMSGAPSFTRENGGLADIGFTLEFANWAKLPTAAITPATYPNHSPTQVNGSFQTGQTTTLTERDAATTNYTFNAPVYVALNSASGVNTIRRWVRTRGVPMAELGVSFPYVDGTWVTARSAGTRDYAIWDQMQRVPGRTVVLSLPANQVVNWERGEENTLAYETVTFRASQDTATTPNTSDLQRATMRLHFL